jgi:hypothetical protein
MTRVEDRVVSNGLLQMSRITAVGSHLGYSSSRLYALTLTTATNNFTITVVSGFPLRIYYKEQSGVSGDIPLHQHSLKKCVWKPFMLFCCSSGDNIGYL